ncbi:related to oxidase [Ramularia collo-cygni]|uniref:Related to oxidase n=1 Tax=Ramularia collo-cygni TaxID=112498 RepID=A0A2D3V341_9PEZI|nr:related to oxidase [Ramularia collo-cygni]CZT22238.1 related to oxidase [Ramularia collo-cygni]
MKFNAINVAMLASCTAAFPTRDAMEALAQLNARAIDPVAPQGRGANPAAPPPFIASQQRVDVSGDHRFIAPASGDDRGPCPGLNAMANHGYLPRNGRASIQQLIDGTEKVFGMAKDLGGFLSYYGANVDGDGKGWSIGGAPKTGISGSHNNYETDSSPCKSDLSQYGSNQKLVLSQFKTLYNAQPDASTANYNLEVLREFRGKRYAESIAKNPDFAYLPFGGILVSQAAYTFIYRFMGNKSIEYPSGVLNKDVLKSFMSITGDDDNMKWTFGNERIPENWYKRNQADEYSVPYFFSDILYFAETQPEILNIGCNQGQVNTFLPLNTNLLTNGAYSDESAAKDPSCFAMQYGVRAMLDSASPSLLAPLTNALSSTLAALTCPSISSFNLTALALGCPGFSLYGGPSAPVAPGAIQS